MNVVIDASAFIRGAEGDETAARWLEQISADEIRGHAPALIYAEVANGELVRVRQGFLDLESAAAVADSLRRLPLVIFPLRDLAVPAMRKGDELGLSVYDACYAVLATETEATLITADRRLASCVSGSILLS